MKFKMDVEFLAVDVDVIMHLCYIGHRSTTDRGRP